MVINQKITDRYSIYNADCIEVAETLPSDSIHYSISSIPFASLYTYSNSERDLGNCRTYEEFAEHFAFMIYHWHRVMMPGRLVSIHCMNLPTSKQHHGYIGLQDFRGDIIRWFQKAGFIYHSEVCIWKDPVIAMQRTKALGLLHKQIKKNSAMSRQGIPDYLVTFRKDGDNPEPITHTNESFPVDMWQRYADPVWVTKGAMEDDGFYKMSMDINPSDTLQKQSAREQCDERHICPLQLQVIDRGIELWSNPNDVVYDPFGGIGSTGVRAIMKGRRALMTELKASYYRQMELNMAAAKSENAGLFDFVDAA
jgi:DNA modification methylase